MSGHPDPTGRPPWDEPEVDADGSGEIRHEVPSRTRLAVLAALASFAIVLLIAAGIAVAQKWNAERDPDNPTGVTQPAQEPQSLQSETYTIQVPAKWADVTTQLKDKLQTSPGVTSEHILSGPKSVGLVANISITRTRTPNVQRSLDVLRQDFLVGLRNRNATATPVGSPFYQQVAGAQATSFEFRYEQKGVAVAGRAVIVNHDGSVYLILFQTGERDYDLQVNALYDLLGSWRWR
jgi:hypothetical protein